MGNTDWWTEEPYQMVQIYPESALEEVVTFL